MVPPPLVYAVLLFNWFFTVLESFYERTRATGGQVVSCR